MRLSILSASVSLGVCGCFVPKSRASELKELSIMNNLTFQSFSVDDTSVGLKKAWPIHNETDKGKYAIDNSEERVTCIELIKNIKRIIQHPSGQRMEILSQNHFTDGIRQGQLDDATRLINAIKALQTKKQRASEEIQPLLQNIQQLQDHDDLYFQQIAAECLVDMLQSGKSNGVHQVPYKIGKRHAQGSKDKLFDQEMVQPWVEFISQRLYSKETTVKQEQLSKFLLARLSKNEIIELSEAARNDDRGRKVFKRLLLLGVADPVTRARAFQVLGSCGVDDETLLRALLFSPLQNLAEPPLNLWLEYMAYSRSSRSISSPEELRAFYDKIYRYLSKYDADPPNEMVSIFIAIDENKRFSLHDMNQDKLVMDWYPKDLSVLPRVDDDSGDHTTFSAALDNEAVVEAFRAAEAGDLHQVSNKVEEEQDLLSYLTMIFKSKANFELYHTALKERQLKTLANEYLQYMNART